MDNGLFHSFGINTHYHTSLASIGAPPILDIATRHERVKIHSSLRANRTIRLIEHDHVPRGSGLNDRKVILADLAASLRADYWIAVPIVVADEPNTSQRVVPRITYRADDISRCPGAPWTRV
jgi:hypothetical protein